MRGQQSMDDGHVLSCGTTMSGKTSMGIILSRKYRAEGIKNLVLDPFSNPAWASDWSTREPEEFLRAVKSPDARQCALHIDEGGMTVGRYNAPMEWCATASRHHGHKAHFYTQAPQQLSTIIRGQCSQAFVFCLGEDSAKVMVKEFPMLKPYMDEMQRLAKGEFIYVGRFAAPIRARIDFAKMAIVPRDTLVGAGKT